MVGRTLRHKSGFWFPPSRPLGSSDFLPSFPPADVHPSLPFFSLCPSFLPSSSTVFYPSMRGSRFRSVLLTSFLISSSPFSHSCDLPFSLPCSLFPFLPSFLPSSSPSFPFCRPSFLPPSFLSTSLYVSVSDRLRDPELIIVVKWWFPCTAAQPLFREGNGVVAP